MAEARVDLGSIKTLVGSSTNLLWLYLSGVAFLAFLQLVVFGANILPVIFAFGTIFVSILPALRFGWPDMPSLICLIAGVRFATSALVWKSLEMSALDEGLYSPELSFTVVFVGILALVLAAFGAHWCWRRPQLFVETYATSGLTLLLYLGVVMASALIIIGMPPLPGMPSISVIDLDVPGGVRALMLDGFIFFVIASLEIRRSSKTALITVRFVSVVGFILIASLILNVRLVPASLLSGIFWYFVCFRQRVSIKLLLVGIVGIAFFSLYVAPAIVDVRYYRAAQSNLSGTDFITVTFEQIGRRLTGEITNTTPEPIFNYYLKYIKNPNTFTERFVGIQELDYVVALAGDQGPVGLEKLWEGLIGILPAWFIDDKTSYNTDTILWQYGAINYGFQSWFEVTPFGNAYTYGGTRFVFLSMFIIFSIYFIFLRLFCQKFLNSLFAVFFMTNYAYLLLSGGVNMLISFTIRTLPFEVILFLFISGIGNRKGVNQHAHANPSGSDASMHNKLIRR
jgi:hypothetical protein